MDFKFGMRALMDKPDMVLKTFSKRAWPGSRDPVIFGALNGNSSIMAKDTKFTFGTRAARKSSDMTPEKKSGKRGRDLGHVTP